MIIRHAFRKSTHPRFGRPERGARKTLRAADAILVFLAAILVLAAVLRLIHG